MLRELFPNSVFGAPATETEISHVESILRVRLPDQLRAMYLECDGFREDRGNANYLLSLTNEDFIGSLLSLTKFFWNERSPPDLTGFVIFGSSNGDEFWGIDWRTGDRVIGYHHHMGDQYEECGRTIVDVFQDDYALYDDLDS